MQDWIRNRHHQSRVLHCFACLFRLPIAIGRQCADSSSSRASTSTPAATCSRKDRVVECRVVEVCVGEVDRFKRVAVREVETFGEDFQSLRSCMSSRGANRPPSKSPEENPHLRTAYQFEHALARSTTILLFPAPPILFPFRRSNCGSLSIETNIGMPELQAEIYHWGAAA
jgi:hypothetical protein